MPLIADYLFDLALAHLDTNTDLELHITSQEAATYANVATYTLGNKVDPSIGAPADGATSGRRVTVAAITDGSVTATGTASHYAIIDTANSRLLVTNALASSQAVTSGNTFSLAAFDVVLPDAVTA